jgi:large subunit ribosomal protein L19
MDIHSLVQLEPNPNIEDFRPGDRVKVNVRVKEGDRERIQSFQGDVIRRRGSGPASSFTVRRVASGIGVERSFLIHAPTLQSVQVLRKGRVRRAKLYYLRDRVGKKARIKEKIIPRK